MEERDQEQRESRLWGGLAVLIYLVAVVCAMLFVRFSFETPEPIDDTEILINFGVSDKGAGVKDLAHTDLPQPTPPQREVAPEPIEEPVTDERSDVEIPVPPQETPPEVQPEPPREVNQRALFPGRTPQSDAVSQGESNEQEIGNAGAVEGSPDGVEYTLTGRSIVGSLPLPDYSENTTGKVVIDVVVDEKGQVTNATYRAQGSTTNNSALISAARAAALKARFTESESFVQGGSITYIFKMN